MDRKQRNEYLVGLIKGAVANFRCRQCGDIVYHPGRGDFDYKPESGLCRSCFLSETIKRMEAETEEYISKRRLLG